MVDSIGFGRCHPKGTALLISAGAMHDGTAEGSALGVTPPTATNKEYNMQSFTLSARLGSMFEVVSIQAVNDLEATLEAIDTIMTKAHHKGDPTAQQRLWASGHIEFRDVDGNLLHEMAAKEAA